jgi:hypothetical protein
VSELFRDYKLLLASDGIRRSFGASNNLSALVFVVKWAESSSFAHCVLGRGLALVH